jgi:hypothetical protein
MKVCKICGLMKQIRRDNTCFDCCKKMPKKVESELIKELKHKKSEERGNQYLRAIKGYRSKV